MPLLRRENGNHADRKQKETIEMRMKKIVNKRGRKGTHVGRSPTAAPLRRQATQKYIVKSKLFNTFNSITIIIWLLN